MFGALRAAPYPIERDNNRRRISFRSERIESTASALVAGAAGMAATPQTIKPQCVASKPKKMRIRTEMLSASLVSVERTDSVMSEGVG
jgi:hypothetical protein